MQTAIAFSYRKLRALLAERQISHKSFAAMAGLSYHYTSRILSGFPAGELASLKISRAVAQVLESEAANAS